MSEFLEMAAHFFKEMLSYAIIAIFLENTIFSRAIGTSTALFAVRKKYNIFLFGLIMTTIITVSSVLTYLITPIVDKFPNRYYIIPFAYVIIIGIVYISALLITATRTNKYQAQILQIIHVSAFNCAVLGALILAGNITDISLGGHIGFGIGTGIGFTMATYFVDIASEKLSSEHIPNSFRGFPITLIYIGIISLAIYGLIGHELPF